MFQSVALFCGTALIFGFNVSAVNLPVRVSIEIQIGKLHTMLSLLLAFIFSLC